MTNKKPIPKAQVRKTEHGYQVYAAGPKGHIAQGQPHKDKKSAQKDAKHFEEVEDVTEGPLQDRRQAQARKRKTMDALRRKQVAQKQLASRAAKDKEKSDIVSRRGIRAAQASKYAQKNWRQEEAESIVDAVASQLTAGFDPFSHKVPRPAGMSKKQFDYKYKATKVGKPVRKPKKSTGMKTPETQAALKYLKGKGPSPYGPGGKYEPKGEEIKHDCASHVRHEEFGEGKCIPGQHTIVETEDGEGYVTHYDVMFDSTIIKDVPVEELEILENWPHTHGKKKIKKEGTDTWHPDPKKDKVTKHQARQMNIRRPGGHGSGNKPKVTGNIKVYKHKGQWVSVPEANEKQSRSAKKKELFKSRKFRNTTPGQSRDFERLSAARMFQAYEQKTDEEMPATNTSGVANWDPLLGDKKTKIYTRKRKKIDGRTKDYKETVHRVQARRDAQVARETEQKLNMFGVSSNPFKEETEMENNKKYLKTKEGSIEEAVLKSLMTETPVNPNDARPTLHLPKKKYLTIKKGSLESAVTNVMTETHAPGHGQVSSIGTPLKHPRSWKKDKQKLIVTKSGQTKVVPKDAPEPYGQAESAGGRGERDVGSQEYTDYVKDLTPGQGRTVPPISTSIKASQQAKNEKKLRSTKIDDEYQVETGEKQWPVGSKGGKDYDKDGDIDSKDYLTARDRAIKRTKARLKNRIQPESLELDEKEVDVKDTRRTVDAIRAYYRAKDASRDATSDTDKGKKKKGDKEKAYAAKERGEIKKDDPDWKHRKYHTGIHGEETDAEAGHATALYKDQWKDRKRADWDKEHGREKMAKQDRADAEVDRKRMWGITQDKWKHAKYASGEEEGKRTIDGNTPSPKDAYEEQVSPLIAASVRAIGKYVETFSGTPNTTHDPKMGQSIAKNPLGDAEKVRKLPKGATTKDTQKKQVQTAPSGSTAEKVEITSIDDLAELDHHDYGFETRADMVTYVQDRLEEKDLSYKERQDMPSSQFALPGKGSGPEGKQGGSYPIPDESHARNALARVSQHGSEAEKAKVRAAVKKKFPGIKISEEVIDAVIDEIHSPKDTSASDVALADYLRKGRKITKVPSKGIPKWAQAAHQRSGPPSAHRQYKPGSGKSEEVEIDEAEKLSGVDQATMAHVRGDFTKRDAILKTRAKAKAKTPAHPDAALTKQRRGEEVEMEQGGLAIAGGRKPKPTKFKEPSRRAVAAAHRKLSQHDPVAAKKWGPSYNDEYEPQGTEIDEQQPIVRTGVSTTPAGKKVPWTHKHNPATGKSTVSMPGGGTSDVTPRRLRAKRNVPTAEELVNKEGVMSIVRDRLEDQYTPEEMRLFQEMLRTAYGMDEGSLSPEQKRKRETEHGATRGREMFHDKKGPRHGRIRQHGGASSAVTGGEGIRATAAGTAAHRRKRGVTPKGEKQPIKKAYRDPEYTGTAKGWQK